MFMSDRNRRERGTGVHMDTRLLTIPEVMGQLHLGRTATYSLIKSRRLASVKVGGARRVPVVALEDFVRSLLVEV